MTRINYSLQPFSLTIGAFNCTDYLDSIAISVPISEPGQPLVWTGDFQVAWNQKARAAGLTEAEFSQFNTPTRWRPGQAPVVLSIDGHPLPTLRIDRYAYDPTTRTGTGTLTQILELIAGDRPSIEPEIEAGANTSIATVVRTLLAAAIDGCTVVPTVNVTDAKLTGAIDSKLSTRDPVSDAQRLAGVNWQWLSVDNQERIISVPGAPSDRPLIFTRAQTEVEVEPDLDAIHFAAERVIVTGSHQVVDDTPPDCPTTANTGQDSRGRKKRETFAVTKPFGVVFPGSGTSTTPIVSEEIETLYAYNTDDSGISLPPFLSLPFEVGEDINTATPFNTHDIDANTPIATVKITSRVAGEIFPQLGTNANLRVAEVTVDTPFRQSRYVPFGVLFPQAGTNFNLYPEIRKDLTSQRVPEVPDHTGSIDPKTGRPGCLEAQPKAEPAQLAPEVRLKTESIRAECLVEPTNWTPIKKKPYIVDFGFIPSQAHADNLATQIAFREARRRDSAQITMPVPIEWLRAGCPLMGRCQIHDAEYQMDGVAIAISNGESKFGFTGGRVGTLPIAIAEQPALTPFVQNGTLQLLLPNAVVTGTIGVDFELKLLAGAG